MLASPALDQSWPKPSSPRPVVFLGAGGIVQNAHVPAYRRAGIPVAGCFDLDHRASARAAELAGATAFSSLQEAVKADAIFDLAVPARATTEILRALPNEAVVLIQKPLGETLAEARAIVSICREKRLEAAVNFQLRFSPNMLALRDAIGRGLVGDVVDVEVRVNTYTPWHLWPFLQRLPRHELLYHSIHYLDLIRSLLGEPSSVYCRVARHPSLAEYGDVRSATILDYGAERRVCLSVFHTHPYGERHAMSEFKVEGTRGALVASMGVNLDYPRGRPDTLELCLANGDWQAIPLEGSWFPDAFAGTMSNLQRYVAGEDPSLFTRVEDALRTMALVEACYLSSAGPGTPIPEP
jgi:predicted dehydrogenase